MRFSFGFVERSFLFDQFPPESWLKLAKMAPFQLSSLSPPKRKADTSSKKQAVFRPKLQKGFCFFLFGPSCRSLRFWPRAVSYVGLGPEPGWLDSMLGAEAMPMKKATGIPRHSEGFRGIPRDSEGSRGPYISNFLVVLNITFWSMKGE